MFSALLFSERVRFLRESHNLSLSQLADIVGKNKSAIAEIEAGRVGATLEAMTNIADLFAVSTDWLLGRIDDPYSNDVIKKLEDELSKLYHNVSLSQNRNLIYFKAAIILYLSKDYFSCSEEYSIEQRADIIFALNFWKYAANLLDKEGYDSQQIPIQSALLEISQINDDEKDGLIEKLLLNVSKKSADKKESFFNVLISYLSGTRPNKRAGNSFAKQCYQCIDIFRLANQELSSKAFSHSLKEYEKKHPSTD